MEFKWDGIRAVVAAGDGRVRVWSRNGNDVTASYPELTDGPTAEALAGLGPLLVDGEIVALDGRGRFRRCPSTMCRTSPSHRPTPMSRPPS